MRSHEVALAHRGDIEVGSDADDEEYVDEDALKIQQDAEDLEWMRELDARMCDQQWYDSLLFQVLFLSGEAALSVRTLNAPENAGTSQYLRSRVYSALPWRAKYAVGLELKKAAQRAACLF